MESSEDVCPLDHLSQGTAFQHFRAENVSRLLRQEAHMDQDLQHRDRAAQSLHKSFKVKS